VRPSTRQYPRTPLVGAVLSVRVGPISNFSRQAPQRLPFHTQQPLIREQSFSRLHTFANGNCRAGQRLPRLQPSS
jgi:hypothetical protein